MKRKLLTLILITVMVFSLAACKGSGKSKPSPVGTYNISALVEDGEETTAEELEILKEMGLDISLELKEDKTGTIQLFGEEIEITWDNDYINLEGESIPYTFDGTDLVIEQEDSKMVFKINGER